MSLREEKDDYIVCVCRNKTKGELISIAKENKIEDLISFREIANVGNVCGGCGEDLEEIIKIAKEENI